MFDDVRDYTLGCLTAQIDALGIGLTIIDNLSVRETATPSINKHCICREIVGTLEQPFTIVLLRALVSPREQLP